MSDPELEAIRERIRQDLLADAQAHRPTGPRPVSDADFADAVGRGTAVVDCYADWCAPCRSFAPVFDETAKRTPDVAFLKLDVDSNPATAQRHQVMSIPTLLLFKDGRLVDRVSGAMPAPQFQQWLDRHV